MNEWEEDCVNNNNNNLEKKNVIVEWIVWIKHYESRERSINYCCNLNPFQHTFLDVQNFIESRTKIPIEQQVLFKIHKSQEQYEPEKIENPSSLYNIPLNQLSIDLQQFSIAVEKNIGQEMSFILQAYENQDHAITLLSQKWSL
ncbi:hypothetical protein ABK040_006604 [Willaertia magna]